MRLTKVRIMDFRCVEDSGDLNLDSVTCLVGKNESGKTAILKALHKLKPEDDKVERFEPARDYPRRKWLPGKTIPSSPPVIASEWQLSDEERSSIEELFGIGCLANSQVRITKGYDNKPLFRLNVDEQAVVSHLLASTGLNAEEIAQLEKADSIQSLQKMLETINPRSASLEKLFQRLGAEFKAGVHQVLVSAVAPLVPTFLFFDQYLRLPGQIHIETFFQKKAAGHLNGNDNIFLALLELAGTTLERLHGASTFEEFNASIRAVSIQISDRIFKYWSQNKHLDVDMKIDQGRSGDPAPFNSGFVFRTRIENKRHRADTSFDDRSTGFVWFFSFLIWFSSLEAIYKKKLIILLDEPGLTLHARAQADLLRYMNEQLKPDYQVVYTTHSPFMIDPDNLLSARTVEDVVIKDKGTGEEKLLGTKIGQDVLSTDPDTVSPLQKALGYEMTQTLFIGRHTLLVEGSSDYLYLKWFSKQLELASKPSLDYRWSISIVGGIDRVPGFVSLFRGNSLHIAALVDVQANQKQKLERVAGTLKPGHLLQTTNYCSEKEADIEDVLGREFYAALVNQAFNLRKEDEILTYPEFGGHGNMG